MSRELQLTKGYITLIDEEDFDYLSQFKWSASVHEVPGREDVRAVRYTECETIPLPNQLLGIKTGGGLEADHINRNTLDNQKANLRVVTRSENLKNRRVWGLGYTKRGGEYHVRFKVPNSDKPKRFGTFKTKEEAAARVEEIRRAYNMA